jgi:hypothetical protein
LLRATPARPRLQEAGEASHVAGLARLGALRLSITSLWLHCL